MKNKRHIFKCLGCEDPTTTLHEIFFGTHGKQICIEYNLQVPLCPLCHLVPHGKYTIDAHSKKPKFFHYNQSDALYYFCSFLQINYYSAKQAVDSKRNRGYIIEMKDHCLQRIMTRLDN